MNISTIVNITLCLLSFLLSVISVVTVVITLRQNRSMIENSTRPYLAFYHQTILVQRIEHYFVLKNFGQTSACIDSFECSVDLAELSPSSERIPFSHLVGTQLSPGQSVVCNVNLEEAFCSSEPIVFNFTYSSLANTYCDQSILNIFSSYDSPLVRASGDGDDLKMISYTLQDLLEKSL